MDYSPVPTHDKQEGDAAPRRAAAGCGPRRWQDKVLGVLWSRWHGPVQITDGETQQRLGCWEGPRLCFLLCGSVLIFW